MMTVRFPNGQAIRYNDANYVTRSPSGYTDIYTKKDGTWIAQVPMSCLIEVQPAGAVFNPIASQSPEKSLEVVLEHLRTLLLVI